MLSEARLWSTLAGLVVASWIKLGNWPAHTWIRDGRRMTPATHAWLFATAVPNLGAYLLYRTTPMLALLAPFRAATMWLGAGSAALATILALWRSAHVRTSLVFLSAAQAGMLIFVAAGSVSGPNPSAAATAVWLSILIVTPLRLLLFLATPAADRASGRWRLWGATVATGLSGLALASFNLHQTLWVQAVAPTEPAILLTQAVAALTAAWAVMRVWNGFRTIPQHSPAPVRSVGNWVSVALLSVIVLAGCATTTPLLRPLIMNTGIGALHWPTWPGLLRYATTNPIIPFALVCGLAIERVAAHGVQGLAGRVRERDDRDHPIQILIRAARMLYDVLEQNGIGRIAAGTATAVMNVAQLIYRTVEQEGFESVLRLTTRSVLAFSRALQRLHTGRLRRNLLWLPVILALAILWSVAITW